MTRSIGLSLAAIPLAAVAALAVVPIYGAVESFPEAHPEPITVRVLSGKGGQPLPHLHLVFVAGYDKGDMRRQLFRDEAITDAQGQVRLPNQIANLPWLQVWVNGKPLCQSRPRKAGFSVELMRREGLSTPNHCGIITVADAPGTFNVFVHGKPKKAQDKPEELLAVELPQPPIVHTRALPLQTAPATVPGEAKAPAASDLETPTSQPIVQEVPALRASSEIGVSKPDTTVAPTPDLGFAGIPAQKTVIADVVTQPSPAAQSAPFGTHFPGAPIETLWAEQPASSEPALTMRSAGQSLVFVPSPTLPSAATRMATRIAPVKTTQEETKPLGERPFGKKLLGDEKPREMQLGQDRPAEKQVHATPAIHSRQRIVRHVHLVSRKSKPRHHHRAQPVAALCPAQPTAAKPMSVASTKPIAAETKPVAVAGKAPPVVAKPVSTVPAKAPAKATNAPAPPDATYKPKPAAGVKLAPPAAQASAPAASPAAKPKP
jgi:hypothetical protein